MKAHIKCRLVAVEIETDDAGALPELIGNLVGGFFEQTGAVTTPLPPAAELPRPRARKRRTGDKS